VSAWVENDHPSFTGSISIASADPFEPQTIHWVPNESSIEAIAHGIMECRRIVTFQPLNASILKETYPGAQYANISSLVSFLNRRTYLAHHWSGSAKMGIDEMSVVDNQLRVKGVTNLRVVDTSIMPFMTNGNVQGTAVMIAEHAADIIIQNS